MRFLRACPWSWRQARRSRPAGAAVTESQVQLILPDDEKNRKSIERFYEKYSQLLRSVYSIEPPEGALT